MNRAMNDASPKMQDPSITMPLDQGAETAAVHQPEPRDNARARLLKAAADLFCRHGINATGVDAVVEAAGTAKATLYKIFGSKEGLVEAVLDREGSAWRQWFIGRIDAQAGSPADKLIAMFDILGEWFAEDRFFGCPFINAVGEFDKKDARYKDIALAHKGVVMRHITDLARGAGCADPVVTAHQLGLLIDGAVVAALITGDPAIAKHGRSAAESILKYDASH
jgi:AcrR family transcriptional regulator